jgi:replication-associated recombination protein RarA
VGQPQVIDRLKAFAASPEPRILILEGPSGSGKTTAAMALAEQLACQDWFGASSYKLEGTELSIDRARAYFEPAETPFRFKLSAGKFHVLRIEELEYVNPTVQRYLKEAMEEAQRRWKCIVLATSNDATKLEKALRHRFKLYTFSAGMHFAQEACKLLERVWLAEVGPGVDMPVGWQMFGWEEKEFSLRLALDRLEEYIRIQKRRGAAQEVAA